MNTPPDGARRDADDSFTAIMAHNRAEFLTWAHEDTQFEASAWVDIASMLADGLIRANVGREVEPAWRAAVRHYDDARKTLLVIVWRSLLDAAGVSAHTVIHECARTDTPRVAMLYFTTNGLATNEKWDPELSAWIIQTMRDRDLTKVATGSVAAAVCLGITPADMRAVLGRALDRIEKGP